MPITQKFSPFPFIYSFFFYKKDIFLLFLPNIKHKSNKRKPKTTPIPSMYVEFLYLIIISFELKT